MTFVEFFTDTVEFHSLFSLFNVCYEGLFELSIISMDNGG